MEIRDVTLPSNIGGLNFATKVYRGLSRDEPGYCAPQVPYVGDISDTPCVEAWMLENVLGN